MCTYFKYLLWYNFFMKKPAEVLFVLIFIGIIIAAGAPGLTEKDAMAIVEAKSIQLKQSNPDLCDQFIDRSSIKKVLFGYRETVSYDCIHTDPQDGYLKDTVSVFVTFYRGVIGMPEQALTKKAF